MSVTSVMDRNVGDKEIFGKEVHYEFYFNQQQQASIALFMNKDKKGKWIPLKVKKGKETIPYDQAIPSTKILTMFASAAGTTTKSQKRDVDGFFQMLKNVKSIIDRTGSVKRAAEATVNLETGKSMSQITFRLYANITDAIIEKKRSVTIQLDTSVTEDQDKFMDEPQQVKWHDNWLNPPDRKRKKQELSQSPKLLFKLFGKDMLATNASVMERKTKEEIIALLRPQARKVRNELYRDDDGNLNYDAEGIRIANETAENPEPHKPTAWYPYAKAIRGWMNQNGIPVSVEPEESPLSQSVKAFSNQYNEIKMTQQQMIDFEACLIEASKEDTEIIIQKELSFGFGKDVEEEKRGMSEIIETKMTLDKKYGQDALMMFYLGRNFGFRASEMFSLSILDFPDNRKDIKTGAKLQTDMGILDEEGFENGLWEIQAITYKSMWANQPTTRQFVSDGKLNKLLTEKRKVVDKKKLKNRNFEAIIGENNFYVNSDLMNKGLIKEPPKPRGEQTTNRDNLYNLIRHCYRKAKITDEYFQSHTVHAFRHIMAQYWLYKTDYDYDFVAGLGHWGTISVLKGSYGAMDAGIKIQKQFAYAMVPDGEQFLRNSLTGKTATQAGAEILRKSADKTSETYKEYEHQQELDLLLQEKWRNDNMDKALEILNQNKELLDAKGNTKLRNWYDRAIIQQKNNRGEQLSEDEEKKLTEEAEKADEL